MKAKLCQILKSIMWSIVTNLSSERRNFVVHHPLCVHNPNVLMRSPINTRLQLKVKAPCHHQIILKPRKKHYLVMKGEYIFCKKQICKLRFNAIFAFNMTFS
jgi:hypothetical protein